MVVQKSSPFFLRLLFWRRACQITVALFFVVLPFMNAATMDWFFGNLLSFKFLGVPLADPLAVGQVGLITGSFTAEMVWGAGLVLVLALCLGPVFCSWLCPYGVLSEWVYAGHKGTPLPRTGAERRSDLLAKKRLGYGVYGKMIVLVAGVFVACAVTNSPVVNQLSMPGWYTRLWQDIAFSPNSFALTGLGVVGALLVLEWVVKKRIWCRYLCPQSVLILVPRLLNPWSLKVSFQKRQCTCAQERPCREACSLQLDPRSEHLSQHLACTNCGQCVEACALQGKALTLTMAPFPPRSSGARLPVHDLPPPPVKNNPAS